jgi:hypothetical protein
MSFIDDIESLQVLPDSQDDEKVQRILNEIYSRKRDFRERGTIIYKDYWNINNLRS